MSKLVRISEAASLALHAMAMLYQCEQKRFTNQEIAGRLGASEHHLAKVMQHLAKAGLVESLRGPQGGFRLGAAAQDAHLLAIYEAIEGPLNDEGCLLNSAVCARQQCVLGDLAARCIARCGRISPKPPCADWLRNWRCSATRPSRRRRLGEPPRVFTR